VPVNPLLQRSEDYTHYIEDSLARVVVVDANTEEKLKPAAGRLATMRADQLEPDSDVPPAPTRRDDMAFWLYSSGSTGKPKAVLNFDGAKSRNLSSIRHCVAAAEALPAEVWRRWKDAFGLTILDGVGSTEMLHIYCSNRLDDLRPGSSGKPVPGYELKILDEDGKPVKQGEAGDLYVKGDSALALYWAQHEKSKRSILGDWFFTG